MRLSNVAIENPEPLSNIAIETLNPFQMSRLISSPAA
jgi:hypothetical protein